MRQDILSASIETIVKYGVKKSGGILEEPLFDLVLEIAKDGPGEFEEEVQLLLWHSAIYHRRVTEEIRGLCPEVVEQVRRNFWQHLQQETDEFIALNELEIRGIGAALDETDLEVLDQVLPALPVDQISESKEREILTIVMYSESPRAQAILAKRIPHGFCLVPCGPFTLGGGTNRDEKPEVHMWMPAYYISKYPVTVGEFQRFLTANRRQHHLLTEPDLTLPAHGISWYEAYAYTEWKGARLLTEAEWEKAAKGPGCTRYPWGPDPDPHRANTFEQGPGHLTPVGQYSPEGDSYYGVSDLAGNVWEWTASAYGPYEVTRGEAVLPSNDGSDRVLRGGAYDFDQNASNCFKRYCCNPGNNWDTHGFRLAIRI